MSAITFLIIKVELVHVSDGSQLWGEQYNRSLTDIFTVEEEISKEISAKLRLRLSDDKKRKSSASVIPIILRLTSSI